MRESGEHIQSYKFLLSILGALLVLTGVTVTVSRIDLGAGNIIAALFIASCKATLVLLYFMHLRYAGRTIVVTFVTTVFILASVIGFLFWDIAFR